MKTFPLKPFIIWLATFGLFTSTLLAEEPTALREWTSTSGSKINASATKCNAKTVFFKTDTGRELEVGLDLIIEKERNLLIKHFNLEGTVRMPGRPIHSSTPKHDEELPYPKGEISGPIKTGDGSTYFLYVPTTLKKDQPAPLIFLTQPGGGGKNRIAAYKAAVERLGYVLAISVESKNNSPIQKNHEHTKRCINHLKEQVPIDSKRYYFSGGSGGAATAMYNCHLYKAAGAMPIIGYSPTPVESGHFYVIGGATDYNRYISADIAARHDNNAMHRLFAGGHGGVKSHHIDDGLAWLTGRFLAKKSKENERLDYEYAMLNWIKNLEQQKQAHRGYYWADFLLSKAYGIEGHNKSVAEELKTKLSTETNQRYAEGIKSIDEFSKTVYHGNSNGGSRYGHTNPAVKKEADKLAAELAGVPELQAVAAMLGKTTAGGGKK